MKKYIAPTIEIIATSNNNLLDWVVGSPIKDGQGDVDGKENYFGNDEGYDKFFKEFKDVWQWEL